MNIQYAFRHFSRRPAANLLLILQMTVIHMVVIAMISSVVSRYDEYAPFSELLAGEGNYYQILTGSDPDTGIITMDSKTIEKKLRGTSRVSCSYQSFAQVLYQDHWDSESIIAISYDDAIISAYRPMLSDGNWIDLQKNYNGKVPIVISENDMGYRVGDQITYAVFGNTDVPLQAIVVGVLKKGAKIIDPVSSKGLPYTAHYFYSNYDFETEEKMLILAPDSLFNPEYRSQPNGILIVQYPNGISDEDYRFNHDWLCRVGCLSTCDLPSLRSNTKHYIYEQCRTLLPIAISVIILAITSIMSISALAAKRQLYDYAVYSLCGLPWKSCIGIHIQEMLISNMSAFGITWCGLLFCKSLYQNSVIRIGGWQLLGSLLVVLFCCFCSYVLPWHLFHRNTTKTILCESGE